MLNPRARRSIRVSLSSERLPFVPGRSSRLIWALLIALALHLAPLTLLVWQPWRAVPLEEVEIPAKIELAVGDGARVEGEPQAAREASPQPAQQPTPPAQKQQPVSPDGVQASPPPSPPAHPPAAALPPHPVQEATEIRLNPGAGTVPPPAVVDNPLETIGANAEPDNVAPSFPVESARRHESGTVVLLVNIDETGHVSGLSIAHSSGYPRLDASAVAAVQHWHFRPALHDGHPVASGIRQAIEFMDERQP